MDNFNINYEIIKLMEKYDMEANEWYDEFSHGDSLARQNAYSIVVEDLKELLDKLNK